MRDYWMTLFFLGIWTVLASLSLDSATCARNELSIWKEESFEQKYQRFERGYPLRVLMLLVGIVAFICHCFFGKME